MGELHNLRDHPEFRRPNLPAKVEYFRSTRSWRAAVAALIVSGCVLAVVSIGAYYNDYIIFGYVILVASVSKVMAIEWSADQRIVILLLVILCLVWRNSVLKSRLRRLDPPKWHPRYRTEFGRRPPDDGPSAA